jgi:hypothetical protein
MSKAIDRLASEFSELSDEKWANLNELRIAQQKQLAAIEQASAATTPNGEVLSGHSSEGSK